jgi:hypothetical protein
MVDLQLMFLIRRSAIGGQSREREKDTADHEGVEHDGDNWNGDCDMNHAK